MKRFEASKKRPLPVLAALASFAAPLLMAAPPAFAIAAAEPTDSISYIYFAPGDRGSTMSGSWDDIRRVQSLRSGNEGLLYIRDGGANYLIRDAATLRQAEAIFEPQNVLGARQGELGSRQGELGRRQGALGAEQGRLGRLQAEAAPRRASELGRQQGELGRQQSELGRQQAELGRQQAELGREQTRLARLAVPKLRALLASAIQRGVAQRVN